MFQLLALAAAIAGQPSGPVATIDLANFKFTPSNIELRAGAPIVMRFRNRSGGAHNFTAPAFFSAAKFAPGAAAPIRNGRIEVPARSTVELRLVPAAGRFAVKCTHTLHSTFGMRGTITAR